MRGVLAAAALTVVSLVPASSAVALQGWERLGARTVEFRQDVDTISIGRSEGYFHRIMFQVDGAPIEMDNVRIYFGNGASYSPPTKLIFSDVDRSRAIDLPGQGRIIRSITFNYRSVNTGQGRATVTVYGQ
jgi:hypothetical protein